MSEERVVVTGATGFVGRHVVRNLVDEGYCVIACGRDRKKAMTLDWYGSVQFEQIDHHRAELVLDEYEGVGLIHLAWAGLPNYTDPFHVEENLPRNYALVKDLVTKGINHVLVVGTCLEYGMVEGAIPADQPTAPENPYAIAKDRLRKQLEHLREESPFSLTWARLFYMYGEGQNGKAILSQLDRAIAKGDRQFDMSGGEQLRDYLPVEAVASQLVALYESGKEGVFNICSGEPISIRQLVEQRIKERGSAIEPNLGHYPYADYEPMAFWGKK